VLVTDDELDARNLLKLLLESAGAVVDLAASAEQGMEHLLTKSVGRTDFAILECLMWTDIH
jgi:DNA-binding response OmpR family regulator